MAKKISTPTKTESGTKQNLMSARRPKAAVPDLPTCWLMKSEVDVFSFADLLAAPHQTTLWDGVRNFEARNILRDKCRPGDHVLFYHSNANPSGIAGIARVASEPYPDPTAFDPRDPHYDPKSREDAPTWWVVDVQAVAELPRFLSLQELRGDPRLADMALFKRSRLSVQPVTPEEYRIILELAGLDPAQLPN
jgi:predicted RNA-binding protein with PUA-like domain